MAWSLNAAFGRRCAVTARLLRGAKSVSAHPDTVFGFIGIVALSLAMVPVHFDEAQYSTWLANPDLSYQTKGPWVSATQSVTHAFEFLPQLVRQTSGLDRVAVVRNVDLVGAASLIRMLVVDY